MIELTLSVEPLPIIAARCMQELSTTLQTKALASALSGAATPLKAAMRSTVPVRTGALKRSIGHRRLSATAQSRIGVTGYAKAIIVGPIKKVKDAGYARSPGNRIYQINGAYKALWLEYGVRPHAIPMQTEPSGDRKRKILRFNGVFRPSVRHPGIRARWWMANANAATGNAQADGFYKGMVRYLDRKDLC